MKLIQDLGIKDFGKYKRRVGIYECPICKKNYEVHFASVKSGNTTKCRSCTNITHRLTNHRLYSTWKGMLSRTLNPKYKYYKDYGGRGIKVCDRWLDVKNFIEDMYPTFTDGLEIDRINNDGNYEPSNCRWATKSVQARNTRVLQSNNSSGYRGVCFHKSSSNFISRIVISSKTINLGYFKTALEGAYAYDKYVVDNSLEHTTNGLYKKESK